MGRTVTELIAAMGGQKDHVGKPKMRLLSGEAMALIADVLEAAAMDKYTPHNWKQITDPEIRAEYVDATLRHAFKHSDGQESYGSLTFPLDPEYGKTHLAHLGACVMIQLHWQAEDERRRCEQKTKEIQP